MKPAEPRPCPYCLQWQPAQRIERHMARCRRRVGNVVTSACPQCCWPIWQKLMRRHLRTCWLRRAALGSMQRQKLCDQIERIERNIARREKRLMKTKTTMQLLLLLALAAPAVADDGRKRDEQPREQHNYIIERQQAYQVQGVPTQRLIIGRREIDVYQNGLMFEGNNVVGVQPRP